MTTYNSAESTKILVRSIFFSSAYFSPLMTNDGVFELWHQGELVLAIQQGLGGLTKKSVQGKQTVYIV